MCGIAGGLYKTRQAEGDLVALAERMLNALSHRGPDDGGYEVGPRLFLGNRRLKIFDLSDAGNQPFFNDDGSIWLVFNGEVYNHYEIRRELEPGYTFHSRTDTEVILRAYEKWGIACLERFIGMFAIALWDGRTQTLYLCRDRIGIKPLYYWQDSGRFLFASEIKALLAAGIAREPNADAIRDYLVDGFYDHTDQTFFAGVRQVRQGCYLTLRDGAVSERRFWDLTAAVREAGAATRDALGAYRATLDDAVQLRMRADVPYAVMLSGGMDSSTLAVLAGRHVGQAPLNVMTFRHEDARYDEGPWADLVSRGRPWRKHDVTIREPHVVDLFGRAIWHQEEPFGGVASFADMLLAELARREGIYVLLEGQGADETLGGYEYYYLHHLADLADRDENAARALHRLYAGKRGVAPADFERQFGRDLARFRDGGARLSQDGTAATRPEVVSDAIRARPGLGFAGAAPFGTRFENAMFRDLTATKVPRVLRFKDKASMMHGIELRVPFLDHRLVALAFLIPPGQKLAEGYTKVCLRRFMEADLPRETCYHVKRQVQTPQREWLRTTLKPLVDDVIHSDRFAARGLFDAAKVRALYARYEADAPAFPNSFFIWQWLSLEFWWRAFMDPIDAARLAPVPPAPNHRRSPAGARKGSA